MSYLLPLTLSLVQWSIVLTLPYAAIRFFNTNGGTKEIILVQLGVLAVCVALVVAPLWTFGLLPMRDETWTAYKFGLLGGGAVSLTLRRLIRR